MKEYIISTDVELSPIERGEIHEFVASSIIFEKKYATFKITHDENCDITYDDTVDYDIGDTVVLQITTTPPNNIISLLVNDVEMVELIDTDDMTLTLTVAQLSNVINVTSGVTVATFEITHDANCDITYDDTVDYKIGDTVVFQITKTPPNMIRSLIVNDIEMVELIDNDDMTLTLTVAQISNVINITSGLLATVTVNDDATSHTTYEQKYYFVGDTVIFNLSFVEGYELDTIYFNGVNVTADVVNNTLTKVLTVANNTLAVTSKTKAPATVTVTDDAKSHTTYEQKQYYVGDTVIFTLSFDEGYELDAILFNAVDVTADVVNNTLTKVLPQAANTLNVASKTTGQ